MKQKQRLSQMITLFLLIVNVPVFLFASSAAKWNVDVSHTSIEFNVTHFFTPVNGEFEDYKVDLHFDPTNLEASRINAEIKVASINTDNKKRDAHLQSADFFEAEKYPLITFKSSKIESKGDNNYVAKGKLKIKNVEKEVELLFKLLGLKELPENMQKRMGIKNVAGFKASLKLDRNDYDVGTGSWAATVVVGDEVNINIDLEANQK